MVSIWVQYGINKGSIKESKRDQLKNQLEINKGSIWDQYGINKRSIRESIRDQLKNQ